MKYIFMALLVGLMTSTNAQVSGFRGIDWGTSLPEVQRIDPDAISGPEMMGYNTLIKLDYVLGRHSCMYTYIFLEGHLVGGIYSVSALQTSDSKDHVNVFDDWYANLEGKYGTATDKGEKWLDDKKGYADRAHHLFMGELTLYANWEFEDDSNISLTTENSSDMMKTGLAYRSPTLIKHLEKQAANDF